MIFEFNTDKSEGYIVHNYSIAGISPDAFITKFAKEGVAITEDAVATMSLVMFEDESRFDLGLVYGNSEDCILWVLNDFTIPSDIQSDKDFISGILIGWLNS